MNKPTPTADPPLSDEALAELKAQHANLDAQEGDLWKAKQAATDAWYVVAIEADRIKVIIEREDQRRKWLGEFQAQQEMTQENPA